MSSKYLPYLSCACCAELINAGYQQTFDNIVDDDEAFVTESMKTEFFEYLKAYTGLCTTDAIKAYTDKFFIEPEAEADLSKKKYLLKGEAAASDVHSKRLGRVVSKRGLIRSLGYALGNVSLKKKGVFDSPILEDDFLDSYLHEYNLTAASSISFIDYLEDRGLKEEVIGERPMWSFESSFDIAPFANYDIGDLPCILGLPDYNGKADDFKTDCAKEKYCAFEVGIENEVNVSRPTCFDAGINTVWRPGGKTKTHTDCKSTYGDYGFNEYIHPPVKFKRIKSELYKL